MSKLQKTNPINLKPIDSILKDLGEIVPDKVIPLLQKTQEVYGFLPKDVILELSNRTGIPASRMYGVATFYEQFHLKPRGRNIIKCCRGTACHVKNGKEIIDKLESLLNIKDGETTADLTFTFETVACLGTCFLAPVIMVNNDYYGNLKPEELKSILEKYK